MCCQIIREESYYFYPQFLTKILNEGWRQWHAELFHQYNGVSRGDDRVCPPARKCVNPGGRMSLNPYYLGFLSWWTSRRLDALHAAGDLHNRPTKAL